MRKLDFEDAADVVHFLSVKVGKWPREGYGRPLLYVIDFADWVS